MVKIYPHTDKTKDVVKDYADFVQRDGLNYLIPNWKRFADKYSDVENNLDEWLNDLDTRRIIDEILATLPENEREAIKFDLKPIDEKVIKNTFEIDECVWGAIVSQENNYSRQKNWYYYRMNQRVFDNEPNRFTKR